MAVDSGRHMLLTIQVWRIKSLEYRYLGYLQQEVQTWYVK